MVSLIRLPWLVPASFFQLHKLSCFQAVYAGFDKHGTITQLLTAKDLYPTVHPSDPPPRAGLPNPYHGITLRHKGHKLR